MRLTKKVLRAMLDFHLKNEEYSLCKLSHFKPILTKDEIILVYLERGTCLSWEIDKRIVKILSKIR